VLHRDELSEDEVLESADISRAAATTPAATASATSEILRAAADPTLTEDLALAILKRSDVPAEVLEQLAKNAVALKSRKVRFALAGHPHTPRHVSVPLARQFQTFDLMKLALSPGVPADVRVAADNVLISRLNTVTVGERLTLARRASGRVAAALLLEGGIDIDSNTADERAKTVEAKAVHAKPGSIKAVRTRSPGLRVMQTALDNPRLTEALVINSVLRPDASAALIHAVARHEKWSRRKEARAALLRTEHLSLARALEFSHEIAAPVLAELLANSRLPAKIKDLLLREKLV
jgi:hypothetical protein